jgi:hypothetical protein
MIISKRQQSSKPSKMQILVLREIKKKRNSKQREMLKPRERNLIDSKERRRPRSRQREMPYLLRNRRRSLRGKKQSSCSR